MIVLLDLGKCCYGLPDHVKNTVSPGSAFRRWRVTGVFGEGFEAREFSNAANVIGSIFQRGFTPRRVVMLTARSSPELIQAKTLEALTLYLVAMSSGEKNLIAASVIVGGAFRLQ